MKAKRLPATLPPFASGLGAMGLLGWRRKRKAPAAVYTNPFGINASGDIVGAYVGMDNVSHGFLYRGGSYTTLDVMGFETEAYGINASGQIVGSYIEKVADGSVKRHSYFYINGLYATFDHPSTTYWTDARGINDQGQIVGNYSAPGGGQGGFIYINGLFASTIRFPSASGTVAWGINNNSQIVGSYSDNSGNIHGYFLAAALTLPSIIPGPA
jgi:uncharacterized membrane protein